MTRRGNFAEARAYRNRPEKVGMVGARGLSPNTSQTLVTIIGGDSAAAVIRGSSVA